MFRVLPAVLLAVFAAGPACAKLVWETTQAEIAATSEDGEGSAVFPMRNDGTSTVRITQVDTSCHCASATPSSTELAPGATGDVTVVMDVRGLNGRLRRTIRVVTDDGEEPAMLGIQLDVISALSVSPKLVWWKIGDPLEAKSVGLRLPFPDRTKITHVSSASPAFAVELRPVDGDGSVRTLLIKPTSLNAEEQARIAIDYEHDGKAHKAYLIGAIK